MADYRLSPRLPLVQFQSRHLAVMKISVPCLTRGIIKPSWRSQFSLLLNLSSRLKSLTLEQPECPSDYDPEIMKRSTKYNLAR